VALFLEVEATDKEGNINWNRIRWKGKKREGNKELIEFIQKHG